MEFLTALLLGVVQGVTEFLPVSSTGHLIFLEHLFGFTAPPVLFHVFVHLGSMAAVVLALRKDVLHLTAESGSQLLLLLHNAGAFFRSVKNGTDPDYSKAVRTNYRTLVHMIALASVPTALIGLLFDLCAAPQLSHLTFAGVGFLLTGVILLVTSMLKPRSELPKDIPLSRMLLIGVAQGFSVLPGISRFAVTLCGGVLCGFSKKTAIRVSFLLFVPVSVGSFVYEVIRTALTSGISPMVLGECLAGMVASGLVGFFSVRRLLRIVQTRSLKGFANYSFAAGLVAVIASFLS